MGDAVDLGRHAFPSGSAILVAGFGVYPGKTAPMRTSTVPSMRLSPLTTGFLKKPATSFTCGSSGDRPTIVVVAIR